MSRTHINCHLIEPAENLIIMLSRPAAMYKKYISNSSKVYNEWIINFIELFNNRDEFLLMAKLNIQNPGSKKEKILERNFKNNYEIVIRNFELIKIKNLEKKRNIVPTIQILPNINNLNEIYLDNNNISLFEHTIFGLFIFIYQYLNEFDKKSIKTNLWNYSLKSITFSYKSFIVGLMLLTCQYTWLCALAFDVYNDFNMTDNNVIILITIVSTIISIFYSYISIKSFIGSCSLYNFIIKVYNNNNISLDKSERKLIFYKKRRINMKTWHIKYNWIADGLSNFLLPILIPIVNIFIILNSETVVDAILNCMAIFFIIQIDEDIFQLSEYKIEQQSIDFSKWIVGCIYCKYIPQFEPIIKKELSIWQKLFKNYLSKYKKNSVQPIDY